MLKQRASGILLHPTSFPGAGGIGELGSAAYRFVDWLQAAGQQLWQILPLNPTGYGDSPYASPSAFAGNPLLISLERLAADGLIDLHELENAPAFNAETVDFGPVIEWKSEMLRRAYQTFAGASSSDFRTEWQTFCRQQAPWLDDYALYRAISDTQGGAAWNSWPAELAQRHEAALAQARQDLAEPINQQRFWQFLFFQQWRALKGYANAHGVRIIGDIPIFVAYDSADVWANPELFQLDAAGNPLVVAGVPPDYFSATGQLWGNPHYRWDVLAKQGYRWWIDRLRATLQTVDIIRIDHFRGFESAWAIPAGDETAAGGHWVAGPGVDVFHAIRSELGEAPIIAEDLGLITPEVNALREATGLPGMKVLHFAWDGDPANSYLPHNYERNCVVYSGTHDNDTTKGWFASASQRDRDLVQTYLGGTGDDIAWDFIRLALTSVANSAIVPLQDVMSLGTEARLNLPGRPTGNWGWRYRADLLTDGMAQGLRNLTDLTGRLRQER